MIMRAFLVGLLCALPTVTLATGAISIWTCTETRICGVDGPCIQTQSRFAFAQLREQDGTTRYFQMGPHRPSSGGGLFHELGLQAVRGRLPAAKRVQARAGYVRYKGAGVLVRIIRPGSEVGLPRQNWVEADYQCGQELY